MDCMNFFVIDIRNSVSEHLTEIFKQVAQICSHQPGIDLIQTLKARCGGNAQMYTSSFDADGRLKTHPVGNDTRTLTYDAASRITNTTDTNPVYNRTYDYDGLDRLISQSDNTSFKLWGYDANSNRANAQVGSTNYPYTVATDSNHLQNVAGPVTKIYNYDAAGNPLSDGATTFTWNAAGKLSTTVKSAKTHTYRYNALDQRISKNGPLSSKSFFFYDENGQLIGEYRDNSSTATPTNDWLVRQETIWLEDIPVAVIKKATATSPILIYFIHADHLNTPRVIVNQSNTPVWRWENTHAFGANLPDENPDGNSQLFEYHPRFPGQYFDKETNLHYNYFRYYEPETGRYISPDPIGLAGGVNVYGYVGQNPLSFTDSNGLLPDAIVDLGLIAFDLASYAYNKVRGCDTSEDVTSLKANTLGLLIPGVTGLGLGVRAFGVGSKTISVLGKNPDYIKRANELGAKHFSIPADVWNRMNKADQWTANKKFLDRMIKRGDDIVLSNPVKDINNVSGTFRRELNYMVEQGFKISRDGTRLVK